MVLLAELGGFGTFEVVVVLLQKLVDGVADDVLDLLALEAERVLDVQTVADVVGVFFIFFLIADQPLRVHLVVFVSDLDEDVWVRAYL